MKEEKIVLAVKKQRALYLFRRGTQVEFVVAFKDGECEVGDYVEAWGNGKYFFNLEDAVDFFKKCKY